MLTVFRSTAKSPLLHEPKLLPPEPTASNQSEEEEEDEEEEDEEDEEQAKDDYVAAVCQYTTVLKETPPGFDDKKYEVNFMNLDQGAGDVARKSSRPETVLRITEDSDKCRLRHSSGSERRDKSGSSERLIEYCDEDEEGEGEDAHLAVSGKLAIHLDTGETSRECCLNRVDDSARTHTRDTERSQTRDPESVSVASDNVPDKPLFIKKYSGRFFQTDLSDNSDVAPVPPPRSKSKESSNNHQDRSV